MTQPPQGGYGGPPRYRGQRPPRPPVPQQRQRQRPPQPPPQSPTAGFGYWDAPDDGAPPPDPYAPDEFPPGAPGMSGAPGMQGLAGVEGPAGMSDTRGLPVLAQPQQGRPGPGQPPQGMPNSMGRPQGMPNSMGRPPGMPGGAQQMPPGQLPYGYEGLPQYAPQHGQTQDIPVQTPVPRARRPKRAARSKTKLTLLVSGTLAALLLAGGGVYYMLGGGSGGAEAGASAPEGGSGGGGSADERPEGGKGDGTGNDNGNGAGNGNGTGGKAGAKAFAGTWLAGGGEALTIGEKAKSGEGAARYAVSYNRPGRLSTCPGVGEVRKSGTAFRLALKCVNGKVKSALAGNAVRSGTKLTVKWDGGSTSSFARQDSAGAGSGNEAGAGAGNEAGTGNESGDGNGNGSGDSEGKGGGSAERDGQKG